MTDQPLETSHGFASDLSAEVARATPPDLVTWLREQIDEDERAVLGDMRLLQSLRSGIGVGLAEHRVDVEDAAYLAHRDPVRALREVETKRLILVECARTLEVEDFGYALAEFVLKALTLPYVDRPGYREEWRP